MGYILCIDDAPDINEIVQLVLAGDGYQVVCALGTQAVELAQRNPPDLILLDLMMPAPDGWEIRRHLLAFPLTAEVPVILLTAAHNSRAWQRDLHCTALLDKPFHIEDLSRIVREIIGPPRIKERSP